MPERRSAAEFQQRGSGAELSDGVEALDAGRRTVKGSKVKLPMVKASAPAESASSDSHLQKRGSQQPASGRQTSQDQTMMHVTLLLIRVL